MSKERIEKQIGVIGSDSRNDPEISKETYEKAKEVGRLIAESGATLLTGAGGGLPLAAAEGAHKAGGLVVGISPEANLNAHAGKGLPVEPFDVLIFEGSGYNGRVVPLIRSCQGGVVVIRGGAGTMKEITNALVEFRGDVVRPVAILTGTGGVADENLEQIIRWGEQKGVPIIHDTEPKSLLGKLIRFKA